MAHLVFQTAFPGDLFLSIPLLRQIKEWDPQTPTVLACRPGLGDFFLKEGLVDEIIEIDKRSWRARREAYARLKARGWDAIFVPHESPRTAGWILRLKAKRGKVGFKKWWNSVVFTMRVKKPMDLPDALRQLSLLAPLDPAVAERFASGELRTLASPGSKAPQFDFRVTKIPDWAAMTLRRLQNHSAVAERRRIFLAPGSVWATKRWTVQGYKELARLLLAQDLKAELVGSPQEKALCDEIADQVPGVINHAGKTSLRQLVDLFAQPDALALVCNDSGAMHAASVVGLPTVAVFGPTVLSQGFRPWQTQAIVVQRDLSCRPCGKHGAKACPLGTHECMREIAAPQVLSALQSLL